MLVYWCRHNVVLAYSLHIQPGYLGAWNGFNVFAMVEFDSGWNYLLLAGH